MTSTQFISAIDADGIGLRAEFYREHDRFLHRISLVDGDDCFELLSSIEGTDGELWPPSPPFQQLSIEERPAGNVALLVGMAGKSHWSASIEADTAAPRLVFDVACRVKDSTGRLGSVYLSPTPARLNAASRSIKLELGRRSIQIAIDMPSTAACHLVAADQQLCITPSQDFQPPHTVRWRYSAQVF